MAQGRDETDTIVNNPPAEPVKKTSTHYMCTQCGTLNEGLGGLCTLCKERQATIRAHFTNFKRE